MNSPAILSAGHAARVRAAVLDHLADALQAAAGHARLAANQAEPDGLELGDARAHLAEAVALADTLDQLIPADESAA